MENRIKEFEVFLEKLIDKYNLTESKEKILSLAQDTIIFNEAEEEDYTKIGNTRLFGIPDLPDSILESEFEDSECFFLSQLNLSDIKGFNKILPEEGMLYFFVDYGKGKVIYSPNNNLKKYNIDEHNLKINFIPEGKKTTIQIIKTLPFKDDIYDDYIYDNGLHDDLLDFIGYYDASIFGYFFADGNIRTLDPLRGTNISKEYKDSILLFHQTDPLGRDVYFLINKEDLKEKRFDKVFYSHFAT